MNVGTDCTRSCWAIDGRPVDVDLHDLALPSHLLGERLDLGRDLLARGAPVGGELDEHGELAPEDLLLELALGDGRHAAAVCRRGRSPRVQPAARGGAGAG